jgi:predicted nucleic acid-binding protein
LDSNILISSIIGKDSQRTIFKSLLHRIMSRTNIVCIPQTVIGESFAVIVHKSSSNQERAKNIGELLEWVQKLTPDIGRCTPTIEKSIIQMALEIKESDMLIDYCDAILVSHAILDENARYIITADRAMQHSEIIQSKIDDRKDGWARLSLADSI